MTGITPHTLMKKLTPSARLQAGIRSCAVEAGVISPAGAVRLPGATRALTNTTRASMAGMASVMC